MEPVISDYDYLFKVLVIGDCGVGKTSLLRRYVDGEEPKGQHVTTMGVDFKIKTLQLREINDKVIKMQMWDTGGQERFQSIVQSFWRGAGGVLIVFAFDDRGSFENVQRIWMRDIDERIEQNDFYMALLVGNKCDLSPDKRQVTVEEAERFASANNLVFVETSALTNANVSDAFYKFALTMTRTCLKRLEASKKAGILPVPAQPTVAFTKDYNQRKRQARNGCGC
jgi:small GTP-binding protein